MENLKNVFVCAGVHVFTCETLFEHEHLRTQTREHVKNFIMQKIFFFFLIISLAACSGSKKSDAATNNHIKPSKNCFTQALVKDMSKLDGCTFLLELVDTGEKLLPTQTTGYDFELANNQLVEIGYKEVKDAMSVCMAENRIVNITCMKLVALTGGVKPSRDKPVPTPCEKINGPYDVTWMKDLVIKTKPRLIDRYAYKDGWAYHLTNNDMEYVYDCQGTELYVGAKGEKSDKKAMYMNQMSDKFTIWVMNE